MVSSGAGEKVRNKVIPPNGRIRPLYLRSASLSLIVSQITEQNQVYRIIFLISLYEKLSASSSMVEELVSGSGALVLCRYRRAQATRTNMPLAFSTGSPSNLE